MARPRHPEYPNHIVNKPLVRTPEELGLTFGFDQRLHGAAETVRGQVMARGWHQHPVAGPALRWLNPHLPW